MARIVTGDIELICQGLPENERNGEKAKAIWHKRARREERGRCGRTERRTGILVR